MRTISADVTVIETPDFSPILGVESLVQQFPVIQVGQRSVNAHLAVATRLVTLSEHLSVDRFHLRLPVLNGGRCTFQVVARNGQVAATLITLKVAYLPV
jgi:hypothetical protein